MMHLTPIARLVLLAQRPLGQILGRQPDTHRTKLTELTKRNSVRF